MAKEFNLDMSQFFGGRNGEDDPSDLLDSNGNPNGQCAEQINIRTKRNTIENKPGEARVGDEISATGGIYGLGKFGDYLVAVHGTVLYILESDGETWQSVKTGLTADTPMSFLEYHGKLYCSNGIETVFEITETATDTFTLADRADVPKGRALAEYAEKFWVGNITGLPYEVDYSVTATAGTPANFYDFTASGSGIELIAEGGNQTAILNFRETLLMSKQDVIKYIDGFDDATPPIPIKQDLFKTDGAINEDCLIQVGADVLYFTGKRFKRLFVSEFEGIRQDENFDRPVLDILDNDIDSDQSEAAMIWNPETGLMFCSLKTKGASANDIRIVYSTKTGAWWKESNIFARKYVVLNGKTYYGNSIIGSIVQDDIGFTKQGYSDITFYESRHMKPDSSRRYLWRRIYLDGFISPNTVILVKLYVDRKLLTSATITSDDIRDIDAPSEALGDETIGDSMWGGGIPGEENEETRRPFEKWISAGRHAKEFYYTLETVGSAQQFRVETANVFVTQDSSRYRLQSSN